MVPQALERPCWQRWAFLIYSLIAVFPLSDCKLTKIQRILQRWRYPPCHVSILCHLVQNELVYVAPCTSMSALP